MPDWFYRHLRQMLLHLLTVPGYAVMLFLRSGFRPRALKLRHLVVAALALDFFASHIEPGDIVAAARIRDRVLLNRTAEPASPSLPRDYAHDRLERVPGESWTRSRPNPLMPQITVARKRPPLEPEALAALRETPFDDAPYMRHFFHAFLAVAAIQLALTGWRAWRRTSGVAGAPLLYLLAGRRAYWPIVLVLEPLLVLLLAHAFDGLYRTWTAGFFLAASVSLFVGALKAYRAERAELLAFQDTQTEAEEYAGVMAEHRRDARPVADTSGGGTGAGIAALRRMAEANRAAQGRQHAVPPPASAPTPSAPRAAVPGDAGRLGGLLSSLGVEVAFAPAPDAAPRERRR